MTQLSELRRAALTIFEGALKEVDARAAVQRAVSVRDSRLNIFDAEFDLSSTLRVYSIAVGKAARAMAFALDETLGASLVRGVVSAPRDASPLSKRWDVFAGGHPLPNEESLATAGAAFRLLEEADREDALILFLISGGGSAMLECARDSRVSLGDLREANRALVSCGASIAEINVVRRALSAVKGGALSARAPRAAQVTLIVSDVNAGHEADVASGPTIRLPTDVSGASHVVEKYNLRSRLPSSVLRALETTHADGETNATALQRHFVLLDNASAVRGAAEIARTHGFMVETADDLVEQNVVEGSAALASRLLALHRRVGAGGVCLISGGEFACPVRGSGVGGRNAETALRVALEVEKFFEADEKRPAHFVALCAGTDGIDGNSPAAGAVIDDTTLTRARERNLNADSYLENSDAYSFFSTLGDAVTTGPTGTNVRDLRILLAE